MRNRSRKRRSRSRKSSSRKKARRPSSRLPKASSSKHSSSDEEFVPDTDVQETEEEEVSSDSDNNDEGEVDDDDDDDDDEDDDDTFTDNDDTFTDNDAGISESNGTLASRARSTSRPSRGRCVKNSKNGKNQEVALAVKRKGKEKVVEGEESMHGSTKSETVNAAGEEALVTCGICLTEKALAERGKLDCCDHFYCFGCIMEWAKVESRCPMCKQRFVTIVKSATSASQRIRSVRIPLRDQVYVPPEELDLPHEDPYADIVCMECQGTGDEGLLLLCDRCDSAAHTFCVGLGRSVPRGDWFCRECQSLIAESSDNGIEEEELVVSSSDEEDSEADESLLRSIVASVNPNSQLTRQQRVQRTRASAQSLPIQTRRVVRRRLPRRLMRRRAHRAVAAPRLSEAARALLLGASSQVNQAVTVSQAPQNGTARTVPQQRRLQERIHAMRSNWGRLQTGDLQFNVLGTQATPAGQQVMVGGSIRSDVPLPPASPIGSHKSDVTASDQPETSMQGDRDVERAWRMMNQAQNLLGTTSSGRTSQQKSAVVPHRVPMASVLEVGVRQSKGNTTNDLPGLISQPAKAASMSHAMADAGTHKGQSLTLEAVVSEGMHEQSFVRNDCAKAYNGYGDQAKQDSPPSSSAMHGLASGTPPLDYLKESKRPSRPLYGKQEAGNFTDGTGTGNGKPENSKSSSHSTQETPTLKGSASITDNHRAKVNGVVNHPSPSREGLKICLTELVKQQTWPIYLAEGLDKEQFKRIARAAVHSLLALCETNNVTAALSCGHVEEQGKGPVTNYCRKCLDQHVSNAVKEAKEKVLST